MLTFTYTERKMVYGIIFMIAVCGMNVRTQLSGDSVEKQGSYSITTSIGGSATNLTDNVDSPQPFGIGFGNITQQTINLGQLGNFANMGNLFNQSITHPSSEINTNIKDLLANFPNGGTYTVTTSAGNPAKGLIDGAYLPYLLGRGFGNVTRQTINLGELGNSANLGNLLTQSITYPPSEINTNIKDLLANFTNGGTYTVTTSAGNPAKGLIDAYLPYLLGRRFGNVTKQTINLGQLGNLANVGNMFNPSSEMNTNIKDLLANIINGGTSTITSNSEGSTKNLIDSSYLPYLLGRGFGNVTKQTINLGQLGNLANLGNMFNPSSEMNTNIKDLLANITNGGTYTITSNSEGPTKNLIDSSYLPYLLGRGFGNVTKQTINLGQLGNLANLGNMFNPSSKMNTNIKDLLANMTNGGTSTITSNSEGPKKNLIDSSYLPYLLGRGFGNVTKQTVNLGQLGNLANLGNMFNPSSDMNTNIKDLLANMTNGGTYTITSNSEGPTKNLIDSSYLPYLLGRGFGNVTKQTINLGQLGNLANLGNMFNPSSEMNTNIKDLLANTTNGGTYTITSNSEGPTKNLIDSSYLPYLLGRGFGNVTKQTINLGQLGNLANLGNMFNPSSEMNTNIKDLLANTTNGGTYTITSNSEGPTKNLIDSSYLPYLLGRGFGNVTKQTINLGQLGNLANLGNMFNPSSEMNTNIKDLLANTTNGGTYTITSNSEGPTKNLIDSSYLPYLLGRGFGNVTKQTINLGQLGNLANVGNMFNPSSEMNTNIKDFLANITNGGTSTITSNSEGPTKNLIDSSYLSYLLGRGFGNVTKQTINLGQLGNLANLGNMFNTSSDMNTNIKDLLANMTNGGTYTITSNSESPTKNLIDSSYLPFLAGRGFGNVTQQTISLGQLGNLANLGHLFNQSTTYPSSEVNTNIKDLLANITNGGTYTVTANSENPTKNLIDSDYLSHMFGKGFGNITTQTINLGQLGNFANIRDLPN